MSDLPSDHNVTGAVGHILITSNLRLRVAQL